MAADRETVAVVRCESRREVVGLPVRCEREYGHGGAHTATFDDEASDPIYTYVLSWWKRWEAAGGR